MPLDASIYQAVGRFPSVDDIDDAKQRRKMNALALLTSQAQYDQGQQEIADSNALRAITQQFGNDPSANRKLLASTGNYKALSDYDKRQLEEQKARAEIGKNTAQTGLYGAQAKDLELKQ